MIINLPTYESLKNLALRTYFRAWNDLIDVWCHFAWRQNGNNDVLEAIKDWPEEWKEYLVRTQPDLQAISSLLQQSMELALKARVCAVSPYLLLLNAEMKFSTSAKQIDFSDLRTLDAVDLPSAVNTLTDCPLSDEFIGLFTNLRSLRNKVMHLGEASVTLKAEAVLRQAVSLYINLWPERHWLSDKLVHAAQTRHASLHDGKYTSTHTDILSAWPVEVVLFKKGEFKKLFGHEKSKRRYLCHCCIYEGDTRFADLAKSECATAFLNDAGNAVSCILCGEAFVVERRNCNFCEGNVLGANTDDWVGYCHSCGAYESDN
ncbi:MAG: hypothetical protein CFE32_11795 [Alphaproteobacteria bacterium PA3]|nr:MAG: hypothetical protein CFE32_11795 [Alphaproteobacteria bacterium PA3]